MIIGAGIFVMGTLFGYICTKNDSEMGLMMENLILQISWMNVGVRMMMKINDGI